MESQDPSLLVQTGVDPTAAATLDSPVNPDMSLALSEDSTVASGRLAVGDELVAAGEVPLYVTPDLPLVTESRSRKCFSGRPVRWAVVFRLIDSTLWLCGVPAPVLLLGRIRQSALLLMRRAS